MAIPFVREMEFAYGKLDAVAPGLRRMVVENPGGFTFYGTNTYVVGTGEVAVLDPGPTNPAHLAALLDALSGESVTHILLTHTHMDHSPAAKPLKEATGAKTYGFGPHGMGKLDEGIKVEEGGDMEFAPDVKLSHGDKINGGDWEVEAVYTPGHTSNHLCFALPEQKALITGDHVMGWSTSVISPPDGDMAKYMMSLDLLVERGDEILWPAHGPAITDPQPFLKEFIAHRQAREVQITACIADGLHDIPTMVKRMYAEVDIKLHRPAAMSVLAHLQHMVATGRATCEGEPGVTSLYNNA
jgi:glyoxylase-like metal-dependent hydrolase (beta-lactamase superfamily II)